MPSKELQRKNTFRNGPVFRCLLTDAGYDDDQRRTTQLAIVLGLMLQNHRQRPGSSRRPARQLANRANSVRAVIS